MRAKPCSVHCIAQTHDAYICRELPWHAVTSVYYNILSYHNYYRYYIHCSWDCCTDKLQRPPKNAGVVPSLHLHKCRVGRTSQSNARVVICKFQTATCSTANVLLHFLEQSLQKLQISTMSILFIIHSSFFNIWKRQHSGGQVALLAATTRHRPPAQQLWCLQHLKVF